ncbi:MAG TPA: hypothetical protein VKI65_13235, partial [Gemmataceae bacterium]|nr:hypothetical protein [Gemmataceae bacterium]
SAAWRNIGGQDHLVATQAVGTSSVAHARWYDFNTTSFSSTSVYQSGEINAGSGVHTYFPSIDIAPDGRTGMTYMESSSNEYMSMYVTGKGAGETSMQAPALVAAGQGSYTVFGEGSPHRAGDFSGLSLDVDAVTGQPTNTFWAANEYATPSAFFGDNWGTRIAKFDVLAPAGASVVASSPSGGVSGSVSSITFTFSEAMDTTSFALADDVVSFSGPSGSLTGQLTGYAWTDSTHLQVNFTAQSANGAYSMVIGPQILRASDGHPMDQNGNGTAGEVPGDQYTASFTISSSRIIEDFEHGGSYIVVGAATATAQVTTTAKHDGVYGLRDYNGTDWIYNNDASHHVRQGDTISAWVKLVSRADGRAYFGFGATSAGTLSLVLAPNTSQLIIQENLNYGFADLAAVGQSYSSNKWYRIEVVWGVGGSITGKLYDSNGTTLLKTVSASDNVITSGGIAFRAIGKDKYFDTVTATGGSGGSSATAQPKVFVHPGSAGTHGRNAGDEGLFAVSPAVLSANASPPAVPAGVTGVRGVPPDNTGTPISSADPASSPVLLGGGLASQEQTGIASTPDDNLTNLDAGFADGRWLSGRPLTR